MITYTTSSDGLSPDQLAGFFSGWPKAPTPETHLRILQNSDHVVIAQDDATGQVVGFITCITDHVLSAYIPLLEVQQSHRGHGLASELFNRLMEKIGHLYMIDCTCDRMLQPFYVRLGMKPSSGMQIRNPESQGGATEGE